MCIRDRSEPALHDIDFEENGFEWIDCANHGESILSYVRKGRDTDELIVVICNFTPTVREGFRMGVPRAGTYKEIFNSDSSFYAGSNVGNGLGAESEKIEWNGRENSITINVPPLGVAFLKWMKA